MKKIISLLTMCFVLVLCAGTKADAAQSLQAKDLISCEEKESGATSATDVMPEGLKASSYSDFAIKANHAGVLAIQMQAQTTYMGYLISDVYVNATLYSDAACTKQIGNRVTLYDNTLKRYEYAIPAAGTYYLRFTFLNTTGETEGLTYVGAAAYCYSGEAKTLDGTWKGTYTKNNTKAVLHKVVMKKAGYMAVSGYGISASTGYTQALTIQLKNSKNKNIAKSVSLSNYTNSYTTYFAVPKGTYYIAVTEDDPYELRCTTKTIKEKKGTSKKKAVTLKKNKRVERVLLNGESPKKADWFKVKLTKKKKLKFAIENYSDTNERITVQVIPASKNVRLTNSIATVTGRTAKTIYSQNKLSKGTYYIKVKKSAKKNSSYYTITLKN